MVPATSVVAPVQAITVDTTLPPASPGAFSADSLTPPTPEQVQAVQEVFARDQEAHLAFGMLGMLTGTLVLRDLAVEAFATSEEEEEDEDGVPKEKKRAGRVNPRCS